MEGGSCELADKAAGTEGVQHGRIWGNGFTAASGVMPLVPDSKEGDENKVGGVQREREKRGTLTMKAWWKSDPNRHFSQLSRMARLTLWPTLWWMA